MNAPMRAINRTLLACRTPYTTPNVFCFLLFSVLCSTGISPQDVVCSPFPNQKFSCSKYKKTCHDIFHVQNSPTSVNFSFSKPIAKKHPCSKGSLGHPIQPIHGHSHCSSNRSTCWEENFSEGLLHCAEERCESPNKLFPSVNVKVLTTKPITLGIS